MKIKMLLIAILIITSVVGLGCISASAVTEEQPNLKADELKQKMDIDIADLQDTPKITEEQAIEAAKNAFPDLAISTNIKVQKNIMTYKGTTLFSDAELSKNPPLKEKGYIDNMPVWIVSFKGLKIFRAGISTTTDELRRKSMHEEENVVVDAETGEALYSFTYR